MEQSFACQNAEILSVLYSYVLTTFSDLVHRWHKLSRNSLKKACCNDCRTWSDSIQVAAAMAPLDSTFVGNRIPRNKASEISALWNWAKWDKQTLENSTHWFWRDLKSEMRKKNAVCFLPNPSAKGSTESCQLGSCCDPTWNVALRPVDFACNLEIFSKSWSEVGIAELALATFFDFIIHSISRR